jgi:site-specific recombinase XerC
MGAKFGLESVLGKSDENGLDAKGVAELLSYCREFLNWDVRRETDFENVKREVYHTQKDFRRVFRKYGIPVISKGMRELAAQLKRQT